MAGPCSFFNDHHRESRIFPLPRNDVESVVHFYRNVRKDVPRGKSSDVAAMLKAVHAQEDLAAAREKAAIVAEKLTTMRLGAAAKCFSDMALKKRSDT